MASFTFDDYLREMYLTVEDIKAMNPETQGAVQRASWPAAGLLLIPSLGYSCSAAVVGGDRGATDD